MLWVRFYVKEYMTYLEKKKKQMNYETQKSF